MVANRTRKRLAAHRQMTEGEMLYVTEDFLTFWFDVMRWLVVMGLLEYARRNTDNISIDILFFTSAVFLVVLIQIQIDRFISRKISRLNRMWTLAITSIATVLILLVIYSAANDLSVLDGGAH